MGATSRPSRTRPLRQGLITGNVNLAENWDVPPASLTPQELAWWTSSARMFRQYFILGLPITRIAREHKCTRQNVSVRLMNFVHRLERLGRLRHDGDQPAY